MSRLANFILQKLGMDGGVCFEVLLGTALFMTWTVILTQGAF